MLWNEKPQEWNARVSSSSGHVDGLSLFLMDQELKLTPKQKEEAKDCLFKLLKENGTYDELYVNAYVSLDCVAICA